MRLQVGFSGDLVSGLCASYTVDTSHLLTAECTAVFHPGRTRSRALVSTWCWQQTASDGFLRYIPKEKRFKSAEHVQRFSRAYLDELHRLSSGHTFPDEPIAVWSEMGAPTLCRHLGLTVGKLRACHIGESFSFCSRVTAEEWSRIIKDDRREEPGGRLYHALKW